MTPPTDLSSTTCVVTGGLGFIGSNLAHELVRRGATVRVVDALVEGHGGDRRNVQGLSVDVVEAEIGDAEVAEVVADADVVFNLAGQVSHTESMRDPLRDLHLNAISHASFLETLRRVNPGVRVVHTSTRQVYGEPLRSPVDECIQPSPMDVNGVVQAGRRAAAHGLRTRPTTMAATSLRLTNVYGPRQRLTSDELGFLPVFIRSALLGEEHPHLRRRFPTPRLRLRRRCRRRVCWPRLRPRPSGGSSTSATSSTTAWPRSPRRSSTQPAAAAACSWSHGPTDHQRIDIGSFHTDSTRIAETLGWKAATGLEDGLRATADVLSWPSVVPVVDLSRRGQRFASAFATCGGTNCGERAACCWEPSCLRSKPSFAAWLGAQHCVAVASGAAALQLALSAAGLGPGDEVLVPAFTAVPTASAVAAIGAVPRAIDVDQHTACITTATLDAGRTARTRAVVVVHLYGYPAELPVTDLLVIEDAAQAHGALRDPGRSAATAYSFYPTKNLGGIGDGGAIITNDAEIAERSRLLRVHGMTASTCTRPSRRTSGCRRSKRRGCAWP